MKKYKCAEFNRLTKKGPAKNTVAFAFMEVPNSPLVELVISLDTEYWGSGECPSDCLICFYNNDCLKNLMTVVKHKNGVTKVASVKTINKMIEVVDNTIDTAIGMQNLTPDIIRFKLCEKIEVGYSKDFDKIIQLITGLRKIQPSINKEFMLTTKQYPALKKSKLFNYLGKDCIICPTISDPIFEKNTPALVDRLNYGLDILNSGLRLRARTTIVGGYDAFEKLEEYVINFADMAETVYVTPAYFPYVKSGHKNEILNMLNVPISKDFLSKSGTCINYDEFKMIVNRVKVLRAKGLNNIYFENLGLRSSMKDIPIQKSINNWRLCRLYQKQGHITPCLNNTVTGCSVNSTMRQNCRNHKKIKTASIV